MIPPIQVGNFSTLGADQNFKMRVIVICAAREAATAALLPKLLELLGKIYVHSYLARGIEVFCYVGATSLEEHRLANGNDTDYYQLSDAEITRILPISYRASTAAVATADSLLDQLEKMWHATSPQVIGTCYVIDTQLANAVTAVQLRDDEPDETIVAAALAITMLITSDADAAVRGARSQRWDLSNAFIRTEQGLFTSFGIGSYSLDHPRLHRLVHDHVIGAFLERAQPPMYGDQGRSRGLRGHQDDELIDGDLENLLDHDLRKVKAAYEQGIAFRTIKRKMSPARANIPSAKMNYKEAISSLARIEAGNRPKIQSELNRLTTQMANAMSESTLRVRIQNRQQLHRNFLDDEFLKQQNEILLAEQGPLVQMHRFVLQSLAMLRQEADKANAPITVPDLIARQRDFPVELSDRYSKEVEKQIDKIKHELGFRPELVGAIGRALVLAPIVVLILTSVISVWFGPNFLSGLPTWATSMPMAFLLWVAIFPGHRIGHRRRIGQQLRELVKCYEAILKEADLEAWRWALAEALTAREALTNRVKLLCGPDAIIPRIRDELIAEEFTASDQVLERIFFDEELQNNLQEVSQQLIKLDRFWLQRLAILADLINGQPINQDEIKEWLRAEAERIYSKDSHLITDLVSDFFTHQTEQSLEELCRLLSTVAVPFLRYRISSQDDPTLLIELFGIHGLEDLSDLEAFLRYPGMQVLNSSDRLRWTFMRVRAGMHLENMKFAIEAQIP